MRVNQLYPILDQVLCSGGNFLTITLCARALSLGEQGKVGFIFAAYVAIVTISAVTIYQYASVNAPKLTFLLRKQYYACLLLICVLLVLATAGFFAVVIPSLLEFASWNITGLETVFFIVYLALQQFVDFYRRTSYIFKTPIRALLVSALIYIPRVALLALLEYSSFLGVLFILILTSVPGFVLFIGDILKYKKYALVGLKKFARIHFIESRWLIVSGPLSWLWAYIPVFVLGKVGGLSAVAVLASVRSISNVGNTVMELLETVVAAKAGVHQASHPSRMKDYMWLVFTVGILIWSVGLLFLLIAGDELIFYTIGRKYEGYGDLLLILWGVVGLTLVFRVHALKLRTEGNTKVVTVGFAFATLVVTIVSPYFIEQYGVYGAAIAFATGAMGNFLAQVILIGVYYRSQRV